MLGPPAAFQRFSDGLGVGFDMWIRQLGELCSIWISSEDGVHNGKANHPGNVSDDIVDLHVHLCQRLVHMLHALAGGQDQFV
jgi:hypothetical protein